MPNAWLKVRCLTQAPLQRSKTIEVNRDGVLKSAQIRWLTMPSNLFKAGLDEVPTSGVILVRGSFWESASLSESQ